MLNFALEKHEAEFIRRLRAIAPVQQRAIFELVQKLSLRQRSRESPIEPILRLVRGKKTMP